MGRSGASTTSAWAIFFHWLLSPTASIVSASKLTLWAWLHHLGSSCCYTDFSHMPTFYVIYMCIIQWDKEWKKLSCTRLLHFRVSNSSCRLTGMTQVFRRCYNLSIQLETLNIFLAKYFLFSSVDFLTEYFCKPQIISTARDCYSKHQQKWFSHWL